MVGVHQRKMATRRHPGRDHFVQCKPFRFRPVVNRRNGGIYVGEDIPHRDVLAQESIVDRSGGITVICRDLFDRLPVGRFIAGSPRATVDKQDQTGRAALIRGNIQIVGLPAVRPVGLVQKLLIIAGRMAAAEKRGKECDDRHEKSDDFAPHMRCPLILFYGIV